MVALCYWEMPLQVHGGAVLLGNAREVAKRTAMVGSRGDGLPVSSVIREFSGETKDVKKSPESRGFNRKVIRK